MNPNALENRFVRIPAGPATLEGNLSMPADPKGLVLFVHGSGSSRLSPRNQHIAQILQKGGLATLLFDLLTGEEEQVDQLTRHLRFDINLLAERTSKVTEWALEQPSLQDLKVGYFGSTTGAAAALMAAAEKPQAAQAVVARSGRPDLVGPALPKVQAPTLLITGENDPVVIEFNEEALERMQPEPEKRLVVVPGASRLFEEPGTLEQAAHLAHNWFHKYLH